MIDSQDSALFENQSGPEKLLRRLERHTFIEKRTDYFPDLKY